MREVTFIQYDVPPLTPGTYTVAVTHTAGQGPPDGFTAGTTFAVSGERFKIDPAEIAGVFPPDLANGEYAGVLPHVLFNRRTLPWERESQPGNPAAPWLAVLLLQDTEYDAIDKALQQLAVKDLVPLGQPIVSQQSSVTPGVGALPIDGVSYPGLTRLEYGETPADAVQAIDLPAATFSRIAPSLADLPYLAHIRKVDDMDAVDGTGDLSVLAVVLGNRIPADGTGVRALLVSLEGLGPLLPAADGTPSPALTASFVRLTVFRAWRFFANQGGETFLRLLESLNPPDDEQRRLTSLQLPFAGPTPDSTAVAQARAAQAVGTLTAADATVLAHDAYGMGYVPLGHHLRHGGETVSWYRGPLAPFAVSAQVELPLAGPDAAARYDPQTGMFDISYAAAWRLGQLLAIQSRSFALAVLAWRRGLTAAAAVAQEQQLIEELLSGAFDSITRRRAARLAAAAPADQYPPAIVDWLARLRLLIGVPFNYLVADERMLAPETLRTFHVDGAWIDALLDGALSIGRASTGELAAHAEHAAALHASAFAAARGRRRNLAPDTPHVNAAEDVTGFLLRSQIVSGWPRLSVKAFSDTQKQVEIPKLRMERLSDDLLLCLFDGVMADFEIREAPEQLHCGVELNPSDSSLRTTLRQVVGDTPGRQYLTDPKGGPPDALVPARVDGQTLMIAQAAANIGAKLTTDFAQSIPSFTSAELALELVKGVGEVEFRLGG